MAIWLSIKSAAEKVQYHKGTDIQSDETSLSIFLFSINYRYGLTQPALRVRHIPDFQDEVMSRTSFIRSTIAS